MTTNPMTAEELTDLQAMKLADPTVAKIIYEAMRKADADEPWPEFEQMAKSLADSRGANSYFHEANRAAIAINRLSEPSGELVEAARVFLERVESIEGKIDNVIQLGAARGMTWSPNDNWAEEKYRLQAAILSVEGGVK